MGDALAELCWDTLFAYGLSAKEAAQQHVVTPAVEKVVEANTLLSGLVFESGGLAAAPAVHNGLTALPATHDAMHGEKVNFGTLTQLALEDRTTAELNDFIAFSTRVGLIHNLPFAVDAAIVCDAMIAADAYGRAFREAARADESAVR
jgi:glycerol dehydrogenase